MDYMHSDLTDKIINAFYKVYNQLGYGFLEKVYEKQALFTIPKIIKSASISVHQRP